MQQVSSAAESAPDSGDCSNLQAKSPTSAATRDRGWLIALLVLALATLVLPIFFVGIWDPPELKVADQARRAAIHVFGASELAPGGNAQPVPTVEEVARGELPVLSMALALKWFGAHAWALRLPLVLWALLGAASLYVTVRRLAGLQPALLAVAILVTSPLYFVHARTALGDAVTMASVTVAFGALLLSWADDNLSPRWRAVAALCGGLGMIAGFFSRGVWVGVTTPALAVGLTWLLTRERHAQRLRSALGAGCLVLGVASALWGLGAWVTASADNYSYALGSAVLDLDKLPTHDAVIHHLGHALFPYSALLPIAVGVALRGAELDAVKARLVIGSLLLGSIAMLVLGIAAPKVGVLPFAAPAALAVLCAVALSDLDRRSGAPALAMLAAALLVLLYRDFENFPDKVFSAYFPAGGSFPEGLERTTQRVFKGVTALGVVLFGVLALEAYGPVRKGWIWLGRFTKLPRAHVMGLGLTLMGLVLSVGYYPVLAAQVSPAGVYEAYASHAGPTERLAVWGEGALRGATFYAGGDVETLESTAQAVDWLSTEGAERRWLVVKPERLPELNSKYRARAPAARRHNLPVLDARSSEALLISNRIQPDERNENPLDEWIVPSEPKLMHQLDARLGQELEVVGWEIHHLASGRAAEVLQTGERYEFRIAYRVLEPVRRTWKTFIHIDGQGKRVNGDHDTLDGKYPLRYWLAGDFVLDRYQFEIDPTYPAGRYTVYFGLFAGNDRMPVTRGQHQDNRIRAGEVALGR